MSHHYYSTFLSEDGCKSPHTLTHLNTHQKHQKLPPPNWHPIALVVAHNIPDSINTATHGHTPSYTRSSTSQTVIQPHDDPSSFFRITSKKKPKQKNYSIATKERAALSQLVRVSSVTYTNPVKQLVLPPASSRVRQKNSST